MNPRAGSAIGLAGAIVVVAGFFLPWLNMTLDVQPLRAALGGGAGAVEEALSASLPSPLSLGGTHYLSFLGRSIPPVEGAATGAPPLFSWTLLGAVAALILAFAVLTAVSSALDLRGADGTVPRALKWLLSGRVGFGAVTVALSGLLLASTRWVTAALSSVAAQYFIRDAEQRWPGLDPGAVSRAASLLDQMTGSAPGVGLYLCAAGGALMVAGGLMGRRPASAA